MFNTLQRKPIIESQCYKIPFELARLKETTGAQHDCNIPGQAQKETQVQEAQEEETLDITTPIAYKRRSLPRVQPQERQQAKPCPSRTPPPPPQAAAAPPPAAAREALAAATEPLAAASLIPLRASN
ncbi:hypothetical protein F2Q68_00029341 [Brassica cretica]|uniref:Uncharacterized protein n=1 Tax=Brassica cretica TaxID=69181 RepID=A0A8S9GB42_BRACR|nr:hypothetical protein F2Q68_00029341 [Brassica cretica]